MPNYPPAMPKPDPIQLTPRQQAIYDAICHEGIPDILLMFLNYKTYESMEHFLRSIAYWVTKTYPC